MSKLFLFSPVGGTDPTSFDNSRDGSLLHICRFYQPTEIILYMSSEILKNQEQDDRYRYCLKKLYEEKLGYETDSAEEILDGDYRACIDKLYSKQAGEGTTVIREIKKPDLEHVEKFDPFYDEFRNIIAEIFRHMEPDDKLIFNVSSGTPAMKSALLVLGTLGEYPVQMVQVATPMRKMNDHNHKDYEVELAWECNWDNDPEKLENRCTEVNCPSLLVMKNEESIRGLIKAYDYSAALVLAKSLNPAYTEKYIDLIEMAEMRELFDFRSVDQLVRKTGYDCVPVKSSDSRKAFEYALGIQLKWKKKQYADFVRALTPLIVDLFEDVLEKIGGEAVISQYTFEKYSGGNKIRVWDMGKLNGMKALEVLNEHYTGGFQGGPISSDHLNILIQHFCENDKLKENVTKLRNFEYQVRNLAAHEIVAITDEVIKEKTGYTGDRIIQMIREIYRYSKPSIKAEYWDSYDKMNEEILSRMPS